MDKLKGSGATFSTSGKPWHPFRLDPKIARQKARLRRLQANGLAPNLTKAQARELCDQAMQNTSKTSDKNSSSQSVE